MSRQRGDRRLELGAAASKIAVHGRRTGDTAESGPWVQVSRLGNPLFNEVIVPDGQEGPVELAVTRRTTQRSLSTSSTRSWQALLPVLYPGVFPNLAALSGRRAPTWWRSC